MTAPGIDSCSLAPLYFEAFFGACTGRCNGFLRLCPKVLSNREPLSKHLFATSLGCRGGMTGSCSHKDRQARPALALHFNSQADTSGSIDCAILPGHPTVSVLQA